MLRVLAQKSRGHLQLGLGVAAAVPVAAAAGWSLQQQKHPSWKTTRLEETHSSMLPQETTTISNINKYLSLVVPTMEATVRVVRLVGTAVLIVVNYESAKLKSKYLADETSSEVTKFEKERDLLQEALQRAQIEYTTESDELNPRSDQYRSLKLQQKQAVVEAAERLAEVEEDLEHLGANQVHVRAANRLLELCRKNGGVYVKVGQHLANLDHIIPPEYVQILSSLFDSAPLTSYDNVCQVIQEDLGMHPEELFESFESEPIASASLAQVHVAHEKGTGRKLAVKVQHRGLCETSSGDIFALTTVVGILDSLFDDFTYGWLADEIAPQLPKELDFENEGRNSERAAAAIHLSGVDCIVPAVVWKHSSKRVLCMEFEEGFKATDVDAIEKAGLKKGDVAKMISSVFNSQVFLSAFVHCDPHEANVLLRERNGKPQIVLIDHGLYKELDDDFRIKYATLWRSLMLADLKGIRTACKSLGVDEMYTLFAAMLTSRPFDEVIERSKTGSLAANFDPGDKSDQKMIQGYAQHFLKDIFDMLGRLPRQMLLLLKMNDCLRHIDYALGSPANTLVVAGRFAARAVYDHQAHSGANRTMWERVQNILDYYRIVFRIRCHDMVVWWTHTSQSFLQKSIS